MAGQEPASAEKFRWIDNDIDISDIQDKFTKPLQNLIKEAEQADREKDEGTFECACDGIEMFSKMLVPDVISKKQWEKVCEKYWFH